jgi:hypothetical protein
LPCNSGPSAGLPAGCSSTAGYSPLTGTKCDSTTGGGSTSSGPLTGGAGSVQEYKLLGTPADGQDVGEGQEDVKVLGFSVEADEGSDLAVKSVKLDLSGTIPSDPASDQFEDYADSVTVWYGSTKVADVDADEFNDDNDYAKTVSFSQDAVVRKGDVGKFYVAVSGNDNLDSDDIGEDWELDVTSVRWMDAQGAIISEDPDLDSRVFSFESFASANDVELKLTEATDNPDAQVVEVDDTNSTDGVTLLKAKLKASGSDIDVKGLLVTVTPSGTGDASEIASQFTLMIDGEEVQSLDSGACDTPGDCDGSGTNTAVVYDFNDVDVTISDGDTVDVEVVADINEVDGTPVAEGDSLTADINADDVDAEDETGEDLGSGDLTGAVNGNAQAFYTEGIVVTPSTMSAVAVPVDADPDYVEVKMTFKVTALGEDVYLDKTTASSTSTSGTPAGDNRAVVVESDGTVLALTSSSISANDSKSEEQTNTFKVNEGDTASFTMTLNATGTDAQVRGVLYGLEWDIADNASGTGVYTFNMGVDGDYKTGYVFVSAS